ncbi:hypothetical protein FRC11_002553 [Ceratobasidium sp. 423]|nr:hypothetical protein FRC11_002553 [Ceratobasidium sp. 423]
MILSAQYMAERTLPPIGPLLLTVFSCILEVFILCFAGWVLARVGILDRKTQKQLNRLNVSLFTPSLLFNKVAFSLSPEKLRELWIIPIFFVGITIVSSLVAWVLGTVFGLKRSQRNFAIAASAFQNSNSLPIALMQSLVVTVHELKWGKGDTKDAMLGRALTYLVLYSTLGMILRWSYGVHLLAQADDETLAANEQPAETEPLLYEDRADTILRHGKRRVVRFLKGLNEFMTIPMYAAVASLIVACVPPMQHALDQHMQPVKGALLNAGSCSIPVTLIVLGAYFYRPKEESDGERVATGRPLSASSSTTLIGSWRDNLRLSSLTKQSGDTSKHPGETKTVFIAVLSRMVITPLVLLPLMAVFTTYDIHELFVDPVFVVSVVLLISSPPALTLAQITQAASGDAFERLISRTIFWAYCVFTPPLTIVFVVLGLILAKF